MQKNLIDIFISKCWCGGVENVVNALARRLLERGFRCRIIQTVYGGMDWVDQSVEWHILAENENAKECAEKYIEFLTKNELPQLIIATKSPELPYIARYVLAQTAGRTGADVSGIKVASWIHGPINVIEAVYPDIMQYIAYADCHFAITKINAKRIQNMVAGAKVFTVGNPVMMKGVSVLREWKKSERKLLFIGRLSSEKRVDIIIEALALAKNRWTCCVVGDGDERERLKELAERVGVADLLEWKGWLDNPWDMDYTNVTALVLSSEYECLPLTAIEASARGIPVISTPVDGAVEYITPGVNGYLFERGSAKGLAEVLDAIDDGLLPDIAPKNCKTSVERYEYDTVLNHFADIIEELL